MGESNIIIIISIFHLQRRIFKKKKKGVGKVRYKTPHSQYSLKKNCHLEITLVIPLVKLLHIISYTKLIVCLGLALPKLSSFNMWYVFELRTQDINPFIHCIIDLSTQLQSSKTS